MNRAAAALTAVSLALGLLAPAAAQAAPAADAGLPPVPGPRVLPLVAQPAALPYAPASFGACRAGGHVYVYGGHVGRKHVHSRANVTGRFARLADGAGASWEQLPSGPPLQGVALVAAPDGTLLRVGGMTAHNESDADPNLRSTAAVARFDPRTGVWREATPLPEPRSSHDAAVLGTTVFVVGGWCLDGGEDGRWHATAWAADLRAEPLLWQPVPAPRAARRAAALTAFDGRLALLGGLGPDGMLNSVELYDPSSRAWSPGPALPGGAFGTAAVEAAGDLLATTSDGRVCAWNGSDAWREITQLAVPRIFHRLVVDGGVDGSGVLAIGGASRSSHLPTLERVDLGAPAVHERTVDAPGRVAYRQALLQRGDVVWAFGGNRGLAGDRFAAAQFADDVWRIDLAAATAERAGALPAGAQSLAVASWNEGAGNVLLGGVGVTGAAGGVGSLAAAWRWDPHAGRLEPFATLPAPRTQHGVVHHDRTLWVLGGVDFRPDDGAGNAGGDARDILTCALDAEQPAFLPAALRLPRPRRSFAAIVLGESLLLIGGLGDGFEPVGTADVLHFSTGTWGELELPAPWVSPQAARIGERIYVACGGTMRGQRFTEDRALWSWSTREGWRQVTAELPFAVRHVQMLAWRNRLLFVANDPTHRRIVLRTLQPDASVRVLEDAMAR